MEETVLVNDLSNNNILMDAQSKRKIKLVFVEAAKLAGASLVGAAFTNHLQQLNPKNSPSENNDGFLVENNTSANSVVHTEEIIAPEVKMITVSNAVNDAMSFEEAFTTARQECANQGIFTYKGEVYSTMFTEELAALSPEDKALYQEAIQEAVSNSSVMDNIIEEAPHNEVEEIATTEPKNNSTLATPIEEIIQNVPLDANKDGKADGLMANTDNDSTAEVIYDFSGKEMLAYVDTENDGIIDALYKVNNGKLEFVALLEEPFNAPKLNVIRRQYRDLDGNETLESRLYDTDGDDVANRVDIDTNGDGQFSKAYIDTDGNGTLDVVADITIDGDGKEQLSNVIALNEAIEAPQLIVMENTNEVDTKHSDSDNDFVSLAESTDNTAEEDFDDLEGLDAEVDMSAF